MGIVRLTNVTKNYIHNKHKVCVFNNLDIEVNSGEFLIIKGASGSGKSTLLNIIGTLEKPTSGKVTLFGKDISHGGIHELSELRLRTFGFIYQAFNLIHFLTAFDNVQLPLLLSGHVRSAELERFVHEMLGRVGLAHRARHYPAELSGGEQQRVAIARALVNNPTIVLADEPTGNLDKQTSGEILYLMKQLHGEGSRTFIVATHDDEVVKVGTRIIDLNYLTVGV